MQTIINTVTDPTYNMALEEYLLKFKSLEDDLFYVWRNEPSIIIGRNQNPFYEVHLKPVFKDHIPIIRRTSGGGTVYHDLGNINFTYITRDTSKVNDYLYFLNPIIEALKQLGVNAEFKPKTHVYVGAEKISGNAQNIYKNRLIHHGTLLYESNQVKLRKYLKKRSTPAHAVASTPAKTTNLKDVLFVETKIESFMQYLTDRLLLNDPSNKPLELSETDHFVIHQLKKDKYQKYSWNYGANARFKTRKKVKNHFVTFTVEKGIIKQIDSNSKSLNQTLSLLLNHPLKYSVLKETIGILNKNHINGQLLIDKLVFYPI